MLNFSFDCSSTNTNAILIKSVFNRIELNFCSIYTAQCGPGTFKNVITKKCEKCPSGTYQPETGKTTCLYCPKGSIIQGGENKNFTSCKGKFFFISQKFHLLIIGA